ncbi:MAG: glycosyltransferase family 2 protein [Candidatus Coatesbacteria bacterium]|nr:glycosyltransferase family 2 protein [Candidatus Coatesbacteria bacterium]
MPKRKRTPCSIIVTNYNGKHLLAECLQSVIEAAKQHDKRDEIIVVDDRSKDGSCAFIRKNFPSIELQANQTNVGFQRASNIGAMIAKHPIIVLLNNDVAVEPDSIAKLCECFDRYRDLFAASARLFGWDRDSYLAGRRVAIFEEGHFRLRDTGPDEKEERLTLFATGGAAAFDREKFLELGGFDNIFHPLYWEDIDTCYRAQKRGWPVIYAPDAVMYHKHQATVAEGEGRKRIRLITARNSYIFLYKNILDKSMLWEHILFSLKFFAADSLKGEFRFQRAFLLAMPRLIRILKRRSAEKKAHLIPDRELIASILGGDPAQSRI